MKKIQVLTGLLVLLFSIECYAQEQASLYERKDTSFKTSDETLIKAETGKLKVPENRRIRNSRLITIKYVRLKSLSSMPGEPLIFLAGGPGNTCTWQAGDPEQLDDWVPYLKVCDVILYDQRGTDDETLVWYWNKPYPRDFLVSARAAGDHYRSMAMQALAAFKARGIDITGYTTTENAHDIEALRKAMNIDKISILGFSYGTHLGLTLIRLYGSHIKNAVLAGMEGLDHTFDYPLLMDTHFKKLAKMASADKELCKDIPDLVSLLERVMKKLDAKPMEIAVQDPLTGKPMAVKVGSFGLALVLRLDIGDASDLPIIPRLLYSIEKDDPSLLKWFVQKRIVLAYGIPGMSVMMDMASGVSKIRRKVIEEEAAKSLFKNVANFPFYDLVPVWPIVKPEFDITAPVVSDIPTLFISGEYDYNTPPVQAEEIKWGFSNATHIVVQNAGHEQTLQNKTIQAAVAKFLSGENVKGTYANYKELLFIPARGNSTSISHPSIVTENGK